MYKNEIVKGFYHLGVVVIGILVISSAFVKAFTGQYASEWYWRVIGTFALLCVPSVIHDHSIAFYAVAFREKNTK